LIAVIEALVKKRKPSEMSLSLSSRPEVGDETMEEGEDRGRRG
jgi:hypothetical protein